MRSRLVRPVSCRRFGAALCSLGLILAAVPAPVAAVEPTRVVSFETADGIAIQGDLYLASEDPSAPLILLFHQAGSDARSEYGPLVGHLLERGYHALATDQRNGGTRLGGVNRTVAALDGREFTYCEGYPDLEATLAFVKNEGFTGPRAAWGSSYSAALVFRLAYEHPDDLAAILAFSPAAGGPMKDCDPELWAADVTVPALALRPASEMERESSQEQLARLSKLGVQTFVADPGVHGSSMLSADRIQGDPAKTWEVVLGFLAETLKSSP